ncbi:MAG: GatB/YqeY domain-containing protein [bacterium]|nr:GatB/YqeY domain-containing protein [bacterium]
MMEDTRTRLNDALKEAMKNKDNERRDVLRMAMSAIKQVEIDTQKTLDDTGVQDVLQKEAKKRRETIDEMSKARRAETADTEKRELAIIEEFLPRQLSVEEIQAVVNEVISQVGATSAKDINKVMGPLMQRTKGIADGKLVNQIVRDILK